MSFLQYFFFYMCLQKKNKLFFLFIYRSYETKKRLHSLKLQERLNSRIEQEKLGKFCEIFFSTIYFPSHTIRPRAMRKCGSLLLSRKSVFIDFWLFFDHQKKLKSLFSITSLLTVNYKGIWRTMYERLECNEIIFGLRKHF